MNATSVMCFITYFSFIACNFFNNDIVYLKSTAITFSCCQMINNGLVFRNNVDIF